MAGDWTLSRFADLVNRMRAAQLAYYRGRRRGSAEETQARLLAALELEGKVDKALEEIAGRLPLFDRGGEE